jgi:mxaD protein
MTAVIESARIRMDADQLWEKVGGFGEIVWHPSLARGESIGNRPGALRYVETWDGQRQVERLDEIDARRHLYRYTMQSSGLPIENCTAELRVDALTPEASLVTWSARFDVTAGDEVAGADMVRGFFRAGLEGLQASYGH